MSGDITGTYRFQTGFYGLTDLPADFQKAVDYKLTGLKNNYCFLEDILIVRNKSEEKHNYLCSIVFADSVKKI